jgi:DNA repair exonuclease SbcCD ATPase subunit
MDDGRIELVAKFVRMLADRLNIQVIFGTHHSIMRDYADRVCEVTEEDGKSKVEIF